MIQILSKFFLLHLIIFEFKLFFVPFYLFNFNQFFIEIKLPSQSSIPILSLFMLIYVLLILIIQINFIYLPIIKYYFFMFF